MKTGGGVGRKQRQVWDFIIHMYRMMKNKGNLKKKLKEKRNINPEYNKENKKHRAENFK